MNRLIVPSCADKNVSLLLRSPMKNNCGLPAGDVQTKEIVEGQKMTTIKTWITAAIRDNIICQIVCR
jgi:hypothetical protein